MRTILTLLAALLLPVAALAQPSAARTAPILGIEHRPPVSREDLTRLPPPHAVPTWQAPLPFAPDHLWVAGGHVFLLSEAAGGQARLATAPLGESGPLEPVDGEPLWKADTLDRPWPESATILPAGGSLWAFDPERGTVARSNALGVGRGQQGAPSLAEWKTVNENLPFQSVEAAEVALDTLFVLGRVQGDPTVGALPLHQTGGPWRLSLPLPGYRSAAGLMITDNRRVYVVGGNTETSVGFLAHMDSYYAEVEPATAALSSWALAPQRLPNRSGATALRQMNALYVALGDYSKTLDDETKTSQTLVYTQLRGGETLALWKEVPLASAPLETIRMALDPQNHQLLLVEPGEDEEPVLRAYTMPRTQAMVTEALTELPEPEVLKKIKLPLVEYETALRRAAGQGQHVFVLLLPGTSEEVREAADWYINFRDTRAMLEGTVCTAPAGETRDQLQKEWALPELPAYVLINPEGERVQTHRGDLEPPGLFQMLQPMWLGKTTDR
ncbi:MAG: hypothetical protein RLY93_10190 [Sumerlaeia bacterium]